MINSEKKHEKNLKKCRAASEDKLKLYMDSEKKRFDRHHQGNLSAKSERRDWENKNTQLQRSIDRRNVQRSVEKSIDGEYKSEVSTIRKQDNDYNRAVVKCQLDCIKERIFRKNRKVEVRRAKQL